MPLLRTTSCKLNSSTLSASAIVGEGSFNPLATSDAIQFCVACELKILRRNQPLYRITCGGIIVSVSRYRERITEVLDRVWNTQTDAIEKAAAAMADCIARGGLVHMFGSGHSVLPVQDMFPRYGAFPGFRPLMDMRLMWTNVIGSGGAKGLLWLERREGYAAVIFENEPIRPGDVMLVFSH